MSSDLLNKKWREQKVLSWVSAGCLAFITAFIWAPSQDGLIGIYALAFILPLLLIMPWQIVEWNSPGGIATALALLFGGYATLSVLWGGGVQELPYFVGVWMLLAGWLCGVIWLNQRRPLNLERLYLLVIVLGALVGTSALIMFYIQHPFTERLSSWTVARNPIVAAQVFGVASLLAWVQSWRQTDYKKSWGLFILALLALLPCLLTQSRGPLIALVLTLFLGFVLVRPALNVWLSQAGVLLIAVFAGLSSADFSLELFERGLGLNYRDQIWLQVFERIGENFWFGIGLAKETDLVIADIVMHHAHNAHLDTLFRTGIVGLGLLIAHLVVLLGYWRKNPQLLPLYLWLIFGVMCVSTNTRILFWQLDAKWFLYWIPTGLIAAALINQQSAPVAAIKKSGS